MPDLLFYGVLVVDAVLTVVAHLTGDRGWRNLFAALTVVGVLLVIL